MPNTEEIEIAPRGLLLGRRMKGAMRGLEQAGVVVEVVVDGLEAVSAVARQSFDLVLCDLDVAGMSGIELLRLLRQRDPKVPVILLSGREHTGPSPSEAAEQGAFCLAKPLKPASLVRTALQQILTYRAHPRTLTASSLLAGAADTVSASTAKNEFGRILDAVQLRGHVVITKHDVPKAILMSIDKYADHVGEAAPDLSALRSEFDGLLQRMQTPHARAATDALFAASSSELGEAAVAQARGTKRSRKRG